MNGEPHAPWAGIHDLPVELLFKVVQEGHENLFLIACLSRALNSFAISHYFRGFLDPNRPDHLDSVTLVFTDDGTKLDAPSFAPQFGSNTDVLPFLSIAFGLKTIDRLTCEFVPQITYPRQAKCLPKLIVHYRSLSRFLSRLDRVGQISLKYHGWNALSSEKVPSSSQLDEWTVAMTHLLDICMEKFDGNPKGGEGFEMVGGLYPAADFKVQSNWGLGTRRIGLFKDIRNPTLHGSNWDIIRTTGNALSNVDQNVSISLGAQKTAESTKKFTISSGALVYPPLSEWTYRFLSTAPLTSLTIDDLFCNKERWNTIFSWLSTAVPGLEDLTIRQCSQISARSLAQFLSFLPRLKHCILTDTRPIFDPLDVILFDLPDLVTFTAPSNFLHITRPKGLQVSKRLLGLPSSLSKLQIIPTCRYGASHGHPYPKSVCNSFVEEVLDVYSNVPWIILDMRKSGMLDFDFEQAYRSLNWWDAKEKTEPRIPGDSFGRVKELIVSKQLVWALMSIPTYARTLPVFLGVLKGLKVLRMVHNGDTKTTASGEDTIVDNVADPPFLKLVKRSCPSLDVVEVEGTNGKYVVHGFE